MRKDVRKKKKERSQSNRADRGCVKLGTAMLRLDRRYDADRCGESVLSSSADY